MSTPTRILVVEDEARIAEVVQSYLEREGHMVVRAATGEDALADFARRRPDLVVLDLGLPGMAGEDVCRRMRAACDVPIILSLIHISEPTRLGMISYAVFCLKK